MLDEIIWLWSSLKFHALWLAWFSKQQRNLPVKHKSKHKKTLLYSQKTIACRRLSFNEMFASKPNLFSARFIAKRSSTDDRHFDFIGGCVYMVKRWNSERPVLHFSRARNFCAVRKLGIRERDCVCVFCMGEESCCLSLWTWTHTKLTISRFVNIYSERKIVHPHKNKMTGQSYKAGL